MTSQEQNEYLKKHQVPQAEENSEYFILSEVGEILLAFAPSRENGKIAILDNSENGAPPVIANTLNQQMIQRLERANIDINSMRSLFDTIGYDYRASLQYGDRDHLTVNGKYGTWSVVDTRVAEGQTFYFMQSDLDHNTENIIVDQDGQVACNEVRYGFNDVAFGYHLDRITAGLPRDQYMIDNMLRCTVPTRYGTWSAIDSTEIGGEKYYLMERDHFGIHGPKMIVDAKGELVFDDVKHGFRHPEFLSLHANHMATMAQQRAHLPPAEIHQEAIEAPQADTIATATADSETPQPNTESDTPSANPSQTDNTESTAAFTVTEAHAGINPQETVSKVMSPEQLTEYLSSLGLKSNQGYFILSENDNVSLGLSPTAPNPFVVWERDRDGDYMNGHYSNSLSTYELADLRRLDVDVDMAADTMNTAGVDYIKREVEPPEHEKNEPITEQAEVPTIATQVEHSTNAAPDIPQAATNTPIQEDSVMAQFNRGGVSDERRMLAKSVDLVEYLRSNGYDVKPHGSEYKVMIDGHDSTIIFPQTNSWFNFNNQRGGDAINFVMEHERMSFPESVDKLLGEAGNFRNMHIQATADRSQRQREDMVLPDKAENNNRAYAYLVKTRGIDRELVHDCIERGDIYQSVNKFKKGEQEWEFNNCVFVGKDETGQPKYASQRSMNDQSGHVFKVDVKNSSKQYGFCIPGNEDANWLTVCEAPIDALSVATLAKRNGEDISNEHILALGGVSDAAIDKFLERNDKINVINICLDNDEAGRKAGERIREKYSAKGYQIIESYPVAKDYNEQLKTDIGRENAPDIDLPMASTDSKRTYGFLTGTKCINESIVKRMLDNGEMYQVNRQSPHTQKPVSDTVFTRNDERGNPIYAISVSHNFNMEKSDFKVEHKDDSQNRSDNYLQHEGESDVLVLYNNPISMLTQQSIDMDVATLAAQKNKQPPKQDHMICCISGHRDAIRNYLIEHPNIKEVRIALDHTMSIDKNSNTPIDYRKVMADGIKSSLSSKHLKVTEKFPKGKNLNQDYAQVKQNNKQNGNTKETAKPQQNDRSVGPEL